MNNGVYTGTDVDKKIKWFLEFGNYTTRIDNETFEAVKEVWASHLVLQKLRETQNRPITPEMIDEIEQEVKEQEIWLMTVKKKKKKTQPKTRPSPWDFPTSKEIT